ncbi:hypothetical protein K8R30_02825 [archaeon]|nr:hypothetical protein [archaeon]
MKRKRRKNSLKSVRLLFGVGIFLVLVLIGLILSNFGVFDSPNEVQVFSLEDKCALVMGNLIHQVRDTGECHVKCVNECKIRELNFDHVEFVAHDVSCNDCDCYCN